MLQNTCRETAAVLYRLKVPIGLGLGLQALLLAGVVGAQDSIFADDFSLCARREGAADLFGGLGKFGRHLLRDGKA